MRKFALVGFLLATSFSATQAQKWKKYEVQADTLLGREQYEQAAKLYGKSIQASKLKTDDAYNALYKRAVCYYYLDETSPALADLEQFIKKFPRVYQSRLLRAFVYRDLGETEKQLEDINVALDLRPLDTDLMKWRASLYLETEAFEKAIADLDYVESVQNDPEVQMYKGYAYYGMNRIDDALFFMKKAIELDATYLAPYLYSGSFLLEKGEYEQALTYLNLALRLDPINLSAIFYKGVALVELKQFDEGCSCLNKAFYGGEDGASDYLKEYCFGSPN